MKKSKYTKSQWFYIITQSIMIISLLICLILIIFPNYNKSQLVFIALQILMFIIITFITRRINKKMKYNIPEFMIVIFELFAICHFILGEIAQFYIIFKYWDSILHTLSGFMLGILGFSFIQLINQTENVNVKLGPVYCVLFAISFALCMGVLWEIIEYSIDSLFKTNMQRYINDQTKELLLGQEALKDTMKDLILDFIGSSFSAILGGISIKIKGVAFNKWQFKKNNKFYLRKDI